MFQLQLLVGGPGNIAADIGTFKVPNKSTAFHQNFWRPQSINSLMLVCLVGVPGHVQESKGAKKNTFHTMSWLCGPKYSPSHCWGRGGKHMCRYIHAGSTHAHAVQFVMMLSDLVSMLCKISIVKTKFLEHIVQHRLSVQMVQCWGPHRDIVHY